MNAEDRIRDELLGGLCHSVNGRLAALHGLLHMARLQETAVADALPEVEAELRHIEHLVELLRWLRTPTDAAPEPLVVTTVLREALELVEHRASAAPPPRLDVPVKVPAVRAPWDRLRRLFTVCAAAQDAAFPIECAIVGRVVQVRFRIPDDIVPDLTAAAEAAGVTAERSGDGFVLSFAALG